MLVHGGTSGIGTMAIALGRVFGLNVIVTCGRGEMRQRGSARSTTDAGFRRGSAPGHGPRGVDVVLDMIGGDYSYATSRASPRREACVDRGSARARRAEIQIFDIMPRSGDPDRLDAAPASTVEFKTMVGDEIARTVWPYGEGGRLKPVIDSVSARVCGRGPRPMERRPHRKIVRGRHCRGGGAQLGVES